MTAEFGCLLEELQSLQQTLKALAQQIQTLQDQAERNKTQWGYCSVALNQLGYPTDEPTLKDYKRWSESNPWDC